MFQTLIVSVQELETRFFLHVKRVQTHITAVARILIANASRFVLMPFAKTVMNTLDGNLSSAAAFWYIVYHQRAALRMGVGFPDSEVEVRLPSNEGQRRTRSEILSDAAASVLGRICGFFSASQSQLGKIPSLPFGWGSEKFLAAHSTFQHTSTGR